MFTTSTNTKKMPRVSHIIYLYAVMGLCLLSFGAESFVFQVAIQKFKDQDIYKYNFACSFVWVWNLVVDIAGGKEAEGVWEHGVEENIWTEVTGEWRRLHNEELNDLYCSPNIVRVIKWRRMRWAGHVARMCEERGCIGSWWGNRREGGYWGDLGVDGWIILGRISRRWDVGIRTGLGWPRIETGDGRLWVR